ncbi:hypothetical protein COBT_001514 [Conglomerata obtusa]
MIFQVLLVLSTTKLKNNRIDSSPSKQQKLTLGAEIIKTTDQNNNQPDAKIVIDRTKFTLQTYTSPQNALWIEKGFVRNQVERYNKISIKNECSMNLAINQIGMQKRDEKLEALNNKQLLSKHRYTNLGQPAYTDTDLYRQKLNAIAKRRMYEKQEANEIIKRRINEKQKPNAIAKRRKTEKENYHIFKKHEEAIENFSSIDPFTVAYRLNNNTGKCKSNLININSMLTCNKRDERYTSCNEMKNKEAVNSKFPTFNPKDVVSKSNMPQPIYYKIKEKHLMNEKNQNTYENLKVTKTKKFGDAGRDELKQFKAVNYDHPIITLKEISSNLYKRRISKYESRENQSTIDTIHFTHENAIGPKINRKMDCANRNESKLCKTTKNEKSNKILERIRSKVYQRQTSKNKNYKNDTSIIKNYFTYDHAINPKNDGIIDYSYQNLVLQFEKIRENIPKIELNEINSNLYQRRRLKSKGQNNEANIRKNSADEKNSIEISSSAHFIDKNLYGTNLHIYEDDDIETKDVTMKNDERNINSVLSRKTNKNLEYSKKTLLDKFFALFTCINSHEPLNDSKKEKLQ